MDVYFVQGNPVSPFDLSRAGVLSAWAIVIHQVGDAVRPLASSCSSSSRYRIIVMAMLKEGTLRYWMRMERELGTSLCFELIDSTSHRPERVGVVRE